MSTTLISLLHCFKILASCRVSPLLIFYSNNLKFPSICWPARCSSSSNIQLILCSKHSKNTKKYEKDREQALHTTKDACSEISSIIFKGWCLWNFFRYSSDKKDRENCQQYCCSGRRNDTSLHTTMNQPICHHLATDERYRLSECH